MKKYIYLLLPLLALLFTACDPTKEELGSPDRNFTEDELSELVTFTQYDKNGNQAADGNYIHYAVKDKIRLVHIYQLREDGSQNLLASGFEGDFTIAPSRGSSPTQKFYVEVENFDGTQTTVEKTITVYVATEMTKELKLLVSNSGQKTWTWNPDAANSNRVWGNGCYKKYSGEEFVNENKEVWWGCSAEELTGQLNHSNTGQATGEEDSNAYMVFSEDGTIKTYAADGTLIRQGTYEITGYDEARSDGWKIGTLKTTQGAILFPFKINGGGEMPTEFDILKLSAGEMLLVYGGNGDGAECTFWRFKSTSDGEGMLTNYGTKQWTWNPDEANSNRVWGNGCYKKYSGEEFVNENKEVWWGCSAEELTGQLNHSDTGQATGEEDSNAYMEFSSDGQIKTYDANGNLIRQGTFEISDFTGSRDASNWSLGTLKTTAGSILFPFKINGGGTKPTDFDIIQLTEDELLLVYGGNGDGAECTFWRFKAKK